MEELNTTIYHPIGTTGLVNTVKVKVMPADGSSCTNCVYNPRCITPHMCMAGSRKDRINIIYEIQI